MPTDINNPDPQDWPERFAEIRQRYVEYAQKMSVLLNELLSARSIRFHTIEQRAKTVDSFKEKILRPGKSYDNPLEQLSDLAGLRVILYYPEDVDSVCELMRSEFTVDEERSVDKRAELGPDRFGYAAPHLVVSLSEPRRDLAEWVAYRELVAEVQVKTVLQHAWASISHELQYKHEDDVPVLFRRRLNRLAGLLELGDEQFSLLRREKAELIEEIEAKIEEEDLAIAMNLDSLNEYLQQSTVAQAIAEEAVAAGLGMTTRLFVGQLLDVAMHFELRSLDLVKSELEALLNHARPFFDKLVPLRTRGALGDRAHWCAVLVVASHAPDLTVDAVRGFIKWDESYIESVLEAASEIDFGR